MAKNNQGEFTPRYSSEWIPDDHLVRIVSDMVDQLDLSGMTGPYSNRGEEVYHPSLLLKLLFYGYVTDISTSRKICAATKENIPLCWLCGEHKPDFRTISKFRKNHMNLLSNLFTQVIRIAMTKGCVSLGRISIDVSKIRTNASKHKELSHDGMEQEIARLEAEFRESMNKALQDDQEEEKRLALLSKPANAAALNRQIQLQKIKSKLQQLKQREMPKPQIKKRSEKRRAKPTRSIHFKTSLSRAGSLVVQSRDARVLPLTRPCRQKYNAMRAKASIYGKREC